jgi:hypothetical protein
MAYRIIKIIVLLLSVAGELFTIILYGDVSFSGMLSAFAVLFFTCLYIISLLSISVIDVVRWKKGKATFDVVPSILTVLFIVVNLLVFHSDEGKFWTKKVLNAESVNIHPGHGGSLYLYANQSFSANQYYACSAKTYRGTYYWKSNQLHLVHKSMKGSYDCRFDSVYVRTNGLLIPTDTHCDTIQVLWDKH